MKKYDYLIVGAGLFGATLAHCLTRRGKHVLVFEKENDVGGMCHTSYRSGITVHDYGAHIFRTDSINIWNFVNKIVPFEPFINSPLAYVDGTLYNMPFNMNTFQQLWGVTTPYEARKKILEDVVQIEEPKNLEDYALSRVGKTIYTKFIKEYTEKQWGKKCSELPASILGRLPLRYTYDNNYYANKKYQGIPTVGYTAFISSLLSDADVELGTVVDSGDGTCSFAETVIYTGSIDEFYHYQFGELEYRSLEFKHEIYSNTKDLQGNAVINYPSSYYKFTRSIEHKHFLNEDSPDTIVSYEYPMKYDGTNKRFYPVETEYNLELYKKYASLNTHNNVIFAGRLGQYKYTDMEQTIYNAQTLAANLSEYK